MTQLFHIPSLENLTAYKNAVKSIKDLSIEDEINFAKNINSNDKNLALNSIQQLIISQLKYVVKIAYKYKNYGLSEDDLIQEGNIGLMKAVKHFDYKKNVRLNYYSGIWINAEIQSFVLKNWKIVKVGSTNNLKKLFFNFRSSYLELSNENKNKYEILEKIKKNLNVNQEEIKVIENYFMNEDVYLDSLEMDDINEINDNKYISQYPQLINYKTPEYYMVNYRDKEYLLKMFQEEFNHLNEREKLIIKYRYIDENKKTHKEISKILNVSSERIRQIEENTIKRLKNKFQKII